MIEIQYPKFTRPSSTITAAGLAGLGVSLLWALVDNFTDIEATATTVSLSTTFAAALMGYLKKERVLPLQREDE